MSDWSARDAKVLWHPYTQHALDPTATPVTAATGNKLTLADGRVLIDAISSWWCTLHGHGREELIAAAAAQARTLDQVIFAGFTHEPAVALAEQLLEVAPSGLDRVFYSDNGSTAVEVALKAAFLAARRRGDDQRRLFVALDEAYHGDTFGAMAVGAPDPFFRECGDLLCEVLRVPPEAAALEALMDERGHEVAAIIVEPLVQGAAGMLMHDAAFLQAARASCDKHGAFLIADEVMTGFGRTGALFACTKVGVRPDFLCLAKGLTGGMTPLAATLCAEEIFAAFLEPDRARSFFHGHTFTAHPIGCAVGLASLDLVRREDTPARLDRIGSLIEEGLAGFRGRAGVAELRRTGGIVALELADEGGYLAAMGDLLRSACRRREDVLLRPLGKVLYAIPPSCTTDDEARTIAAAMSEVATEALAGAEA
jgi:adenosylmethionine-8-amino-7-oxononanoate aminotransferase